MKCPKCEYAKPELASFLVEFIEREINKMDLNSNDLITLQLNF